MESSQANDYTRLETHLEEKYLPVEQIFRTPEKHTAHKLADITGADGTPRKTLLEGKE